MKTNQKQHTTKKQHDPHQKWQIFQMTFFPLSHFCPVTNHLKGCITTILTLTNKLPCWLQFVEWIVDVFRQFRPHVSGVSWLWVLFCFFFFPLSRYLLLLCKVSCVVCFCLLVFPHFLKKNLWLWKLVLHFFELPLQISVLDPFYIAPVTSTNSAAALEFLLSLEKSTLYVVMYSVYNTWKTAI